MLYEQTAFDLLIDSWTFRLLPNFFLSKYLKVEFRLLPSFFLSKYLKVEELLDHIMCTSSTYADVNKLLFKVVRPSIALAKMNELLILPFL